LTKIYGIAAFAVSVACGVALERKIGEIKRRCVDSLVMMPAMSVRSYARVVGCASALERDVLALDRTCIIVQTKNGVETTDQANQKKKKGIFFFLRNRDKLKINCRKIKS
jgi:hypothetical protein